MHLLIQFFLLTLLTSCSHLFYRPGQKIFTTPDKFFVNYEDHFFKTKDGVKLHGWLLKSPTKAKGSILYFHGNAENLSSHFLNLAWLTKHNINVFIFDYRGYGRSEGEPSQEGVYLDSLAAIETFIELASSTPKKVLYGQSLGGNIALRGLIDSPYKDQFQGMVMDSTFLDYKDLAADKLKQFVITWPLFPLAYLVISNEYAAKDVIDRYQNMPLLVIHGMKDNVVPYQYGKELYQSYPGPKKMWSIEEGHHISTFHNRAKERDDFLNYFNNL